MALADSMTDNYVYLSLLITNGFLPVRIAWHVWLEQGILPERYALDIS
jgi:hypothetical protein